MCTNPFPSEMDFHALAAGGWKAAVYLVGSVLL